MVFNKGKTLLFYKDFNKHHFREIEEEINLLQEIYFNSMFGPNQLKNNYLIDWELQSKVVELQEYFFNFKTNFLKLEHVTSPTRVLSKIPQDLTDKLKKIDDEFERLLSSHNAHQYIPSVEDEQPGGFPSYAVSVGHIGD